MRILIDYNEAVNELHFYSAGLYRRGKEDFDCKVRLQSPRKFFALVKAACDAWKAIVRYEPYHQ